MFSLFAAMLSQAMFKFVEKSDDPSVASREAVKEHIKKLYGGGMSQAAFDDFLEIIPHSYWVSHCRRWCPPPDVMIKDIIDVYMAFVGVLDPHTATAACPEGFSFFKAGHEDLLKTQLEYIATGCLSDLPDCSMYISVGAHPTTGLEIFKCIRGSNDLEGALLFCFLPFNLSLLTGRFNLCLSSGFHTDVQFYVRTPKGKCMGPKLLNALLCMHLHRVTMRAARKVGLIDRSMKHMNYELRGKNHIMCDWLGFSKEDNLYPNHVRAFTAEELPRVPRRGFYYGLNCQADAVTSTAAELREEDDATSRGMSLPLSIPKSWLTTGALRTATMSQQRTGLAAAAGSSSSPSPPTPLSTTTALVPTGHSMVAFQQQCAPSLFNQQVCKFKSLYSWTKLRFRMDQADISAIQRDPVARDDARVMIRRAFRLRGLLLPLSVALKLTKSCDIRQRSFMNLNAKRSLALVFSNIQTPALPTAAQMDAPVVSAPAPNPVNNVTPAPEPLPQPRQKRQKMSDEEAREKKSQRERAKRAAAAALRPDKPPPLSAEEIKVRHRERMAAKRLLTKQQLEQQQIVRDGHMLISE